MTFSGPVPLIYNPASGGGRGEGRFQDARRILKERGIHVEPVATQAPRHATTLAAELAGEGYKHLFVMGGDGTLSEATNGLLPLPKAKRPTLGFIPAGTGNDFLRDFEVLDTEQGIDRIMLGQPRPIDAMRIRYNDDSGSRTHYGINIFGTGFAAQAGDVTNRHYKWARGQAYNLGVLHKLVGLKPTHTEITLDGKAIEGDIPMVMVCNSVHTGGAMKMAPMARSDDGWLDVLTVENMGRMELLGLLGKIRDGGHVRSPKVTMRRAKKITVKPDDWSPLLTDGEVYGGTPAKIDIMAGALKVLL